MPRPRKDERLTLDDEVEIMRLTRQGVSQSRIAQIVGIHQGNVSRVIRRVIAEVVKERNAEALEHVSIIEAGIREVIAEAWQAYEKSKADLERETQEEDDVPCNECSGGDCQQCGGTGRIPGKKKTTRMRQGRLASNAHLNTLLAAYKDLATLKGLMPDTTIRIKAEVNPWEELQRISALVRAGDVIDGEIKKVQALPAPKEANDECDAPGRQDHGEAGSAGTNGRPHPPA